MLIEQHISVKQYAFKNYFPVYMLSFIRFFFLKKNQCIFVITSDVYFLVKQVVLSILNATVCLFSFLSSSCFKECFHSNQMNLEFHSLYVLQHNSVDIEN